MVVGSVQDPADYLDSPESLEQLEKMMKHATHLALVVEALRNEHKGEETDPGEEKEEPEITGPKTAEFPDSTFYSS